jgi:hypothetical protein
MDIRSGSALLTPCHEGWVSRSQNSGTLNSDVNISSLADNFQDGIEGPSEKAEK